MDIKTIRKKINEIDEKMPDIEATTETERERIAAITTVSILKLELLDNEIRARIISSEVEELFDIYSEITLENIKNLLEIK
ncbi:unnamed protein product [marine sediment metagenome]|uniref:Uncharacterized protein n=1 Tax=marine sediment metagenome TaxID=412755 RepID=X1LNS8_9ZZZZ